MSVQANFATPTLTSKPYTCPADHKMYVVAVNPRLYEPKDTQDLIWEAGTENKDFTFAGNKVLTITFDNLVDEVNANRNPFFGAGSGSGPANGIYNHGNENTDDAINTRHGRRATQNHVLNVSVNRNVSKIGYKIQDVDSQGPLIVRYQQEVEALDGGIFYNLSFNITLQNINNSNNIISGKRAQTCGLGECVIDASWKYTPAKTPVRLQHRNLDDSPFADHIVGYSDFYFCLAPPKIIVNKTLVGIRVNDTDNKRDQFEISIGNSSSTVKTFTTSDKGSTIANGSSDVVGLVDGSSYTITERVMNGSTLGDIANYNATYTCNNATTGTPVTIPSDAMIYNPTTKTRSFSINNVGYGDEITCTITNTPKSYTFSGIVFNDNGGITNPNSQLIGGIYNNSAFFNGVFDANEAGIDGTNGVKARLSDCGKNPSTTPIIATVDVTKSGKYEFTVLPKDLEGKTDLCIEEIEPNNWLYSVDTTPNIRKFSFNSSVTTYRTGVEINGSKLNLDFGNVIKENTALVLIKSQYVHDCSLTNLMTITVNYTSLPTAAYSKEPIANIQPGQCIAYRIEAINRGNVPLTDVVIKDILQKRGENGALITSTLVIPPPIGESSEPTFPTSPVALGDNRIVITNGFNLGTTSSSKRKAIRFNTKYGNTMNP
ncbi:hypothetical protein [Psychrobacter maritimus]|uniref:hypothetical protein n=1 Tax=Psychrobacter maritimus TaxID=256325 RepID=UPI003FD265F8